MTTTEHGAMPMGENAASIAAAWQPMEPDVRLRMEFQQRARDHAPVFHHEPLDLWVVSRYEDVRTVLVDEDDFSSHGSFFQGSPNWTPEVVALIDQEVDLRHTAMLANAGVEDNARIRSVVARAFTPNRVAGWRGPVRQAVNELIDALPAAGSMEFLSEFAAPLTVRVVLPALGAPVADAEQLTTWVTSYLSLFMLGVPYDEPERVRMATHIVDFLRYMRVLVRDRAESPADDQISDLASALSTGNSVLSEDEVVVVCALNLLAGAISTLPGNMTAIVNTVASDAARWQQVANDPAVASTFVDEALRLDNQGGFFRTTTREVTLAGTVIPAGARVHFMTDSASRDERVFTCPHAFTPDRPDMNKNLNFGVGPHYCIAAPLARLTFSIALEELSRRLPDLSLAGDDALTVPHAVTARMPLALRVQWSERRA